MEVIYEKDHETRMSRLPGSQPETSPGNFSQAGLFKGQKRFGKGKERGPTEETAYQKSGAVG